MTLEVKQLVVKSTVTQRHGPDVEIDEGARVEREEALRAEVLDECRRWIAELRNARRER